MRLLVYYCLMLTFISGVFSGCPFSNSAFSTAYHEGYLETQEITNRKDMLIKNNFVINEGEPGYIIWIGEPIDDANVAFYNETTTLLIAEQLHMDKYLSLINGPLSAEEKVTAIKLLEDIIPLEKRCKPVPVCDSNYTYHTPDGSCNNLKNPKWGQKNSPYGRLFPAHYDDGIYTIRKSVTNEPLPSARKISNIVLQRSGYTMKPMSVLNYGGLLFGQYYVHDVGMRETYQNNQGGFALRCCSQDYKKFLPETLTYYGCDSISIPNDDPYFKKFEMSCLSYIRSQPVFSNDCKLGAAEIANAVTHILDHSTIYGSNKVTNNKVRSFVSGKLLTSKKNVLPITPDCTGEFCYFTGDPRGAFYPTLGLLHSIFVRFHNTVCDKLGAVNKDWTDEKLFQEAKRIITAVYEHILYDEWLPYIIGHQGAQRRNVSNANKSITYCGSYDPTVDPSNLNEAAAGAFRVYHENSPDNVSLYDKEYKLISSKQLKDMLHGISILEDNYDNLLRGLLMEPATFEKYPDQFRNTIFNNDQKHGIGMDMLSVDIQRGRDHGLPPYHILLSQAIPMKKPISDWNELRIVFSQESIDKLRKVYQSIYDIDALVGMLLEKKFGVYSGPVTSYIIEEQFYRHKFGNRFTYCLHNAANPFTPAQIQEINKITWAQILCENSDIDTVFPKAFEIPSLINRKIRCNSFRQMNYNLWNDC